MVDRIHIAGVTGSSPVPPTILPSQSGCTPALREPGPQSALPAPASERPASGSPRGAGAPPKHGEDREKRPPHRVGDLAAHEGENDADDDADERNNVSDAHLKSPLQGSDTIRPP
jgi:hypothetical protein